MADAGLAGQVEIRHGDANEMTGEDTYDLVVMNTVPHEMGGPAGYRNVSRRARLALEPGGLVMVSKLAYPYSPTAYRGNPVSRMLAGVHIHEARVGRGAITQGELRSLIAGARCSDPRIIAQPIPTRLVMMGER